MKNSLKINLLLLLFAVSIIYYSCGNDNPVNLNPPGDGLAGYVTHINMNLIPGGYYSVSLFCADSVNPFNRVPLRTDSLNLKRRDNLWETPWNMHGIPQGRYYVASTWSRYPRVPNEIPMVLGTYGCDTSASCTSYIGVSFPNYEGVFRNIISWTDTTKRMN
jgi:hypothetical protein